MSVIEKVPFLHEIMIADAQELARVISPGSRRHPKMDFSVKKGINNHSIIQLFYKTSFLDT